MHFADTTGKQFFRNASNVPLCGARSATRLPGFLCAELRMQHSGERLRPSWSATHTRVPMTLSSTCRCSRSEVCRALLCSPSSCTEDIPKTFQEM